MTTPTYNLKPSNPISIPEEKQAWCKKSLANVPTWTLDENGYMIPPKSSIQPAIRAINGTDRIDKK